MASSTLALTVKMRNFPAAWVAPDVLEQLPSRISNLLSRFGRLRAPPQISDGAGIEGPSVTALAAFEEPGAAIEAVRALHGFDLRSEVEKTGGGPAGPLDKFWVELIGGARPAPVPEASVLGAQAAQAMLAPQAEAQEVPGHGTCVVPRAPPVPLAQEASAVLQGQEETELLEPLEDDEGPEVAAGADSDTQASTEPPSENEGGAGDAAGQHDAITVGAAPAGASTRSAIVTMRHFPTSWSLPDALVELPLRIAGILGRFGRLVGTPKITPGTESGGPDLSARATFEEEAGARAAVEALHGIDWRSPAEVQQGGGRSAEAWERFWVEADHAESLGPPLVVGPHSQVIAMLPGTTQPGGAVLPSGIVVGLDPPEDESVMQWPKHEEGQDAEESYLILRGLPRTWGELQAQLLFTVHGGIARMRLFIDADFGRSAYVQLLEPNMYAEAGKQLHGRHVDGDDGEAGCLSCCYVLSRADRLRQEEEAKAQREREAAAEALRRWEAEAAEAERLAANIAPGSQAASEGPADVERAKRLQAAAAQLRDPAASGQRRRMLAALFEAERRRQAPLVLEAERRAMASADAEAITWRCEEAAAERFRQHQERQARAREVEAMKDADLESRKAEESRVEVERRRKKRELKAEAAESRDMARADAESQRIEKAVKAKVERQREEVELNRMQVQELQQRRVEEEEHRRRTEECRGMLREEERSRLIEQEAERRRVEEQRRRQQVLDWQKKRQRLTIDSEEEELGEESDEDGQGEAEAQKTQKLQEEICKSAPAPLKPRQRNCLFWTESAEEEKQRLEEEKQRQEEQLRQKQEEAGRRQREEEEEERRWDLEQQRRRNFVARIRQQEADELEREQAERERAKDEAKQRLREKTERRLMDGEDRRRKAIEVAERKEQAELCRQRAQAERQRREEEAARRKKEEADEAQRRKAEEERLRAEEAVRRQQEEAEEERRKQEAGKKRKRPREDRRSRGRGRGRGRSSGSDGRSGSGIRGRCQRGERSRGHGGRDRRRCHSSPSRGRGRERGHSRNGRSRSHGHGRRKKNIKKDERKVQSDQDQRSRPKREAQCEIR